MIRAYYWLQHYFFLCFSSPFPFLSFCLLLVCLVLWTQGLGSRHWHKEPWSLNCFCCCLMSLAFVFNFSWVLGAEANWHRKRKGEEPWDAVRKAGRSDLWFYIVTRRRPPVVVLCQAQEYSTVSQSLSVSAWCHGNYVEKLNIFFLIEIWFASFFLIPPSKTKCQPSWSSFPYFTLFPKTAKCIQAGAFLAR